MLTVENPYVEYAWRETQDKDTRRSEKEYEDARIMNAITPNMPMAAPTLSKDVY